MRIKNFLTLCLSLLTLTAMAQDGGITGRVVSRVGRTAVDGVKITLMPGEQVTTSDAEGRFLFEMVPGGEYGLLFEADEYEPLRIAVRVDKMVRDLQTVVLVPAVPQEVLDDSIFTEFDVETASDANSLPTSLSASKDIFNSIACD